MVNNILIILLLASLGVISSCDMISEIKHKAKIVNHYESVALGLAKDNRLLNAKIIDLQDEIRGLKAEKKYLQISLAKYEKGSGVGRNIASVRRTIPGSGLDNIETDYVKFGTYKWTAEQILAVAEAEFDKKNYEKSAQYFRTFLNEFPLNDLIDDQLLFQAGVSAYESKRHYNWAIDGLNRIIVEYPASKYYRGAKLWLALSNLKLGDKVSFYNTVEEFRKKYRNTPEWKILRTHYEDIVKKYK